MTEPDPVCRVPAAAAQDGVMERESSTPTFVAVFLGLGCLYSLWLLALWPGILGEDSLAVIFEIQSDGRIASRKPDLWYYFVKLFYAPARLVEAPIIAQTVICCLLAARILAWCWANHLRKTTVFLFIVCLQPITACYATTLYSDGLFSFATAALVFEAWLCLKRRRVSLVSMAVLGIALPFAVFARGNGIVMLGIIVAGMCLLPFSARLRLGLLGAGCIVVVGLLGSLAKREHHDTLFPLALFETVNFLQPRVMSNWQTEPRVTQRAVETLTRYASVEKLLRYYDPDYWDPLVYFEHGPGLLNVTEADKRAVVQEFWKHNLWRNVPDFIASRVNIFLVAGLAQGGPPSLDYTEHVLRRTESRSVYRAFNLPRVNAFFQTFLTETYRWRVLLWSPFLGMGIMVALARLGLRRRDLPLAVVLIPLFLQLAGIFFFSIAGEYRYLMPFFILTIALLPILAFSKRQRSGVVVMPAALPPNNHAAS